jgi:Fe-S-cluster-containing dehydrogenase component
VPRQRDRHSDEGLNEMVYNRCIGTRYCSNNCPYKVRRFNFLDYTTDYRRGMMRQNPDVTVRSRGIMEKCTYCVQRIERKRIDTRIAGTTSRTASCRRPASRAAPRSAIEFGSLNDPAPRSRSKHADPRRYDLCTSSARARARPTWRASATQPRARLRRAPQGGRITMAASPQPATSRDPSSPTVLIEGAQTDQSLNDSLLDHVWRGAGQGLAHALRLRAVGCSACWSSASTYTLYKGIGSWGNNIPVGWAFGIINFVWWIGIGTPAR